MKTVAISTGHATKNEMDVPQPILSALIAATLSWPDTD
jgi:hypothetical protein